MFRLDRANSVIRAARAALLLLATIAVASSAAADTPLHEALSLDVGANGVDVALFRQMVAARYHVRVERIVASDIDRDGDVDIVAASSRTLMIWLNDGVGHLEQQQGPHHVPVVAGQPADGTWNHRDEQRDDSLQDGAPSLSIFSIRAHDPPPVPSVGALPLFGSSPSTLGSRSAAPRAPPA